MISEGLTISELRKLFEGTPFGAGLEYALAQDHVARVAAIQSAVDFACNQLEQHKHKKQGAKGAGLSEDELTLQICEMLVMAGFQAEHDADTGGHCDVVIKGKDLFLWLAEAKKHDSYSWLEKGFQQLSTRYSTGVAGQDNAEVLIFCYVSDAKKMLESWRAKLEEKNPDVQTMMCPSGNPHLFYSVHKHVASGMDFRVRHKAIALYWRPQDD